MWETVAWVVLLMTLGGIIFMGVIVIMILLDNDY
jgi:hypothetical protein